ncbi:hypothetical protein [Paraburkholderia elongata]|uniref:Uncharacterized protein n=1 Tax=Paraburkholderia elongata TaxID=2675747 RepID=A0A972NTV8_9BURK|nr:hypothetical protein [Paraburkholderia elongata]NPT59703.1 hypothetical protein [Paraburkholderia elongata]
MEFDYTRNQGEKRTYHVNLTLMKRTETGEFTYSALIHCGGDYRGPAKIWPLMSTTSEAAELEAISLVKRDIEDLVGIDE